MSTYRIELERNQIEVYVEGRTQGYRVVLTITNVENIPEEVFVFERKSGGNIDFANVASPADIEEYPVEASATLSDIFFRRNSVDLVFRSIDLLNEAVEAIVEDLRGLIAAYKSNIDLGDLEVITIRGSDYFDPLGRMGPTGPTGPSQGIADIVERAEDVSATGGEFTDICSVDLTAGKWLIIGKVTSDGTVNKYSTALSIYTGNTTTDHVDSDNVLYATNGGSGEKYSLLVEKRYDIASLTTIYLKANPEGTSLVTGQIEAIRLATA